MTAGIYKHLAEVVKLDVDLFLRGRLTCELEGALVTLKSSLRLFRSSTTVLGRRLRSGSLSLRSIHLGSVLLRNWRGLLCGCLSD